MAVCVKFITLPHKKQIRMKKLINFIIAALLLPFAGCKDGKRLGKFDTFTRMVRDSCDYYFGTSYRTSCFYFPKLDETIRAQEVEVQPRCIRLKVKGEWQERNFEGTLLHNP